MLHPPASVRCPWLPATGRQAAAVEPRSLRNCCLRPTFVLLTVPCPSPALQDVAVEPLNPHLFWSAAEDGAVRQFDTRLP